jgi:hypothetical protein
VLRVAGNIPAGRVNYSAALWTILIARFNRAARVNYSGPLWAIGRFVFLPAGRLTIVGSLIGHREQCLQRRLCIRRPVKYQPAE